MRLRLFVILGLTVSVISGCSSWNKSKSLQKDDSWSITKLWKKEYQKPATLAAIWSPDSMSMAGQRPERGFGGRIYFYNERSQAVPVDGDLIVHAYLTTPGVDQDNIQSDKKFEFSAEQLSSHFSPSEIGASYSIWVPWDDAMEGMREEVTLIPTFKSKDGSVVQGTPAKVFLPGKPRDKTGLPSPPMQTVSFQREILPTFSQQPLEDSSPIVRTKTTTIQVPDDASFLRTQRQAFTLGGKKSTRKTETSSAGVVVGGGQRLSPIGSGTQRSTSPLRSPQPDAGQPSSSPATTPSGIDLRTITPPPRSPSSMDADPVAQR